MGVVYEARDERLERTVAVKTMSMLGNDTARKRFWREARAAASVNHPNVCQIYEIGEDRGELFIAMELLEGQPLAEHLLHGAISVSRAVSIGLDMLAALSALHARGVIHRDLKPSNVFITPHGVKLLDFGLARPEVESTRSMADLTQTGVVMGTPRYMAPELVTGDVVDTRSDLFSAGAILFEMLAGRPAFDGRTVADVIHATVYEHPPALSGSPTVAAIDRVIRRALAKRPGDRLPSADVMAEELRWAGGVDVEDTTAQAHALKRLVVLPFRILRPDPETDFLAFSLPDAITSSLSGIGSLIVRSSAIAARFAGEAPDLRALATEANVDAVVMGTLLRSGDQLRAVAQLVEAPSGTLLSSLTVQSTFVDLFGLQDDIASRVVEALSLPLTGPKTPAPADAPRNARAYELYLRGNELARSYDSIVRAREMYERCLELDSSFAPAWAHLGRCHRVIGKYIDSTSDDTQAQAALDRALTLNPRLSVAHKFYANLEADIGLGPRAITRLIGQATRHGNDPELFAGLVHACRYCGLYDESIAAHAEARRLDPNVPTSVAQTIMMSGDIDRLLALERTPLSIGADDGIRVIGLGLAGRRDEARRLLLDMTQMANIPAFRAWTTYLLAWLERRVSDMIAARALFNPLRIMDDPEAIFQEGSLLSDAGEYARALEYLQRAVARGYYPVQTLSGGPQFERVRHEPAFQAVVSAAQTGRQQAFIAFREAGGERLLGAGADPRAARQTETK
jgi:serine/threonine protein kinase/tetratricopeptide (TPR) repeat protein